MPITSFSGVSEAARAVQDFLFDRDVVIPDDMRDQLKALVGPTTSPVDTVVKGSELIYTRHIRVGDLDAPVMELAAGLALVAEQYNFHGMAEDNRGSKLALTLMRDAKVKKPDMVADYPTKDEDPEPKPEFATTINNPTPDPAAATPAPAEGARRPQTKRVTDTNKS